MTIRRFTSAAELQATDNLAKFINAARASNPFGVRDWDAIRWELPKRTRASRGGVPTILFIRHATGPKDRRPMKDSFGSFARAVICRMEQQNAQGLDSSQFETMVRACRYLYDVILERGADPTSITAGDLSAAAKAAQKRETEGGAYNVGMKLARLVEMMNRHGLTCVPLEWTNAIRGRSGIMVSVNDLNSGARRSCRNQQ